MTELAPGYTLHEGADVVAAHRFLTTSYWAKDVAIDTVTTAFANSIAVSIRHADEQVAAARVVTDRATFAYVQDVYVLADHRGKGLGRAMLDRLSGHRDLQTIGRWLLFTKDMQDFYATLGWREYPWPERTMIIDPKVFPA